MLSISFDLLKSSTSHMNIQSAEQQQKAYIKNIEKMSIMSELTYIFYRYFIFEFSHIYVLIIKITVVTETMYKIAHALFDI